MLIDFISDTLNDLHETRVLWQVGVVIVCILFSVSFSRAIRRQFPIDPHHTGVRKLGAETFYRIIFPLLLWVSLFLGKVILSKWQHVNLLKLLIPIAGSLALIRFWKKPRCLSDIASYPYCQYCKLWFLSLSRWSWHCGPVRHWKSAC